jgi:tRNA (adenine57-N1/adenine58-N1)-methyltransferase
MHTITLQAGKQFHTHKGILEHDSLIGGPEGVVVVLGSTSYLALRPLLSDFVLSMPRGAQVVYPKDAGQIVQMADVFPGAHVVEAGVGSGALSMSLLRAVGDTGRLSSYERRADLAEELPRSEQDRDVDRVVLDMLAPWDVLDAVSGALVPGGLVCCYVATTTQLSRTVEALREHGTFTEPTSWESMVRGWHVEGLAVRPEHRMIGHTGFLVTSRRMADGATPPVRRRRPSKGAYGEPVTETTPGPEVPGGAPAAPFRPNLP